MMPAAKHFDPVLGVDIHIIQPPGPVPPIPIPHPFIGFLFDPFDYVPIIGSTIYINGVHRAIAGTMGKTVPGVHFPIGGTFVKPPANECEMFMGSSTVQFDNDAASYMALPALSCQDVGMIAPLRLNPRKKSKVKSMVLPTSVVLPIPLGPPVLIGGPPTISLMGLATKLGLALLGKAFKRLAKTKLARRIATALKEAKAKAIANLKPGFLKCVILKAEPVNLITGDVVVEQQDFELPGRISLKWTRYYNSSSRRKGSCGVGWETPADARLEFDQDGIVIFRDGTPGGAVFESLPATGTMREMVGGSLLRKHGQHLVVRTAEGSEYWFPAKRHMETEILVESIQDLSGNTIAFLRDENGDLEAIADNSGRVLKVVSRSRRIESISLDYALVFYSYDINGDLIVAYDSFQEPYQFSYRDHRLTRHTDRVGLSFHYSYDDNGRCIHTTGDGGLYDYTFSYYTGLHQTEVRDSRGQISLFEYDERSLVLREIDALGNLYSYEYDEVGRTAAVIDPLGNRTQYVYDDSGNVLETIQPDGTSEKQEYNPDNYPMVFTDANGSRWQEQWDERGLLRKRVSPLGATWTYDYSDRGDLIEVKDPLGFSTRYLVNADGSLNGVIDTAGRRTAIAVDSYGNTRSVSDPAGFRTSYHYDKKFRLTRIDNPAGNQEAFEYDAEDNLVGYVDASGQLWQFSYFGLGRLAKRIEPNGSTVSYSYDTEENLTAVTNAHGQQYRLDYDAAGRLVSETDYWGRERKYSYDPAGNVTESIDAAGRKLLFKFDKLGRLVERRESDERFVRYEYDPNNNLIKAENQDGVLRRVYDRHNQLLKEVQGDFTVVNTYDPTGQRIRRTSSLGRGVSYIYDAGGYVTTVAVDGEPVSRMERDQRDLPARELLGQKLERKYSWDSEANLTSEELRAANTLIGAQTYRYDSMGNLVERSDLRQGNTQLSYTPSGKLQMYVAPDQPLRILLAGMPGGTLSFPEPVYPGSTTVISPKGSRTYEFDFSGNLARRSDENGEMSFEWDSSDRLIAASKQDGTRIRFTYDPLGRRLSKEVGGVITRFHWDGDVLLSEASPGKKSSEFVHYPESHVPLAIQQNGTSYFFQNDGSGIPYHVYSAEGRTVWSAAYGPFAEVEQVYANDLDQPIRLQGQYYDEETGLCYNRFRYYDPAFGRFISPDPIGIDAGPDPYRYGPNTWTWVDPFGLNCSSDAAKLRSALINKGFAEPGFPNAAHHIVMSNSKDRLMKKLRTHLKANGVIINSHLNGVFLPRRLKDAVGRSATAHSVLHTKVYKQTVYNRLIGKSGSGLTSELGKIRSELLAGIFPH